ncbi:EF-hand calcium-binding domain-containing protein 6 isoform X3 [Salvelinus fontinalis]|uniref:EF-hand calcium-binding domain-containing protein 6 isoform X3 n=1 Tax=Salvelinus fontinalis TaxID=8038 RepID=UPI002485B646|nr:EF-hand calcium-binding domain-containing protein 6 isoform X3 [Salvelinus fontinalis]
MRRTPPVGLGDLTLMSRGLVIAPRPWTAQRISITHTPGPSHSYTHTPPYTPVEGQGAGEPRKTALQSDSVSSVQSAPDEHLFLGEIKALLPRRLGERLEDVRAAFKALDPEGSGSVTRGEFRQVVEAFLFPLTQTQLNTMLAKVSKRDSVTVDYMDFLRRYSRVTTAQRPDTSTASSTVQRPDASTASSTAQRPASSTASSTAQRPASSTASSTAQRPGTSTASSTAQRPASSTASSTAQRPGTSTAQRPASSTASSTAQRPDSSTPSSTAQRPGTSTAQRPDSSTASSTAQRPDSYTRCVSGSDQRGMTLTEIQQRLKHKIGSNLKNVIRAFRLFDYNRDGQIQQHELRRILENYCFPLTQRDYQRLWTHHSPNNMATMSYKVFLEKLGLESNKYPKFVPEPPKLALGWQEISPPDKIKLRNRALSQNATGDTQDIQGLTQDELQTLFLKKLCVSCTLVWRALQAFDVTLSGLVSQEDLRAVLSSFLFPMSLSTFQSLTCRFGVRATGPVKWKQFLGQFQGPVTEEDYTTPQTDRVPELPNAEEGSLTEFYPILKRAFNQLDRGRIGRITRADLRQALEVPQYNLRGPQSSWSSRREPHTPRPRLSPAQVRELLILLDPEHTGVITQPSLELLKPKRVHSSPGRETLHTPTGGWKEEVMEDAAQEEQRELNETQYPQWIEKAATAADTWTTVKGLLRDKLSDQIGPMLEALGDCDPRQTGSVYHEDLRRIIQCYGLPLSHTHFNKLCESGLDPGSCRVRYRQFLRALGLPTGETQTGTIHYPRKSSDRLNYQSQNALVNNKPVRPRSATVGGPRVRMVENIMFRKLKERLDYRHVTLDDHIRATARSSDGMLSLRDLKKILDDSWITLDEMQFRKLNVSLGFKDGKMSCSAFLDKYDENQAREQNQASGGNRGNLRAKPRLLTAEDCLCVIKERIENIHGDILSAFRVMDKNCDSVVDRHDFRELYDSLGLVTKEREYQRLLQLLGLQPGANLNYPEFFTLVQSSGKSRRQNFKPANGPDQLHEHLASNARHRWTAMSKVICRFDEDGQGLVFKKDLRSLLYTYDLPISPDEFEELWARYDGEGRGSLTCAAFLEKLGVDPQEVGHARKDADTTPTDGLPAGATLQDVERVVQGNCEGLSSALNRLDKKREGLVRVEDLQSLLQRYNCPLHRHQLAHLLHTLKVPMDSEDRTLSYVDFLKAFDHVTGKGREHPPRPCGSPDPAESLEWLSPERAVGRIRELVTASMDILHKAFSAFDRSGNGTVTPLEFRRVLDHFCARLSDPQFRFLLDRMKLNWENHTVYWRDFLNQFNLCNLDVCVWVCVCVTPEDWSDRVGKAGFPTQPQPLPISEEVVSARLYTITKEIVDLDHTHNDTISKEDFRMMCDRHFMRLTCDQFERVWEKLPVNVLGDLEYREFLKHASGTVGIRDKTTDPEDISPLKSASPPSPGPIDRMSSSPLALQRPKTTGSNLQRSKSEVGVSSRARRPSTAGRERESPLVNCEEVERRLKGQVQRCWRDIQRSCREEDRDRDGEISTHCFLDILQSLNVSVTQKELDRLAVKFDMRDSGHVSYPDFLRHFLLNFKPPAVRQPFERPKLPLPTTPMSGGVLSRQCVEAMLRLYGPVQQFWRSLRQNFVTLDHNHSGKISIKEFRKVLRQFRVNLSEEEFFHLTSFFDKNTTGKISYNDFLRGFLH